MNAKTMLVAIVFLVALATVTACAAPATPTPLPVVATKVAPPTQPPPTVAPTTAPTAVPPTAAAKPTVAPTVAPTKPKTGGSLTYVLNQDIATLDPGMMRFAVEQMIGQQIYDSLYWLDKDQNLQPGLAKSFKVNADSTVFDFELRNDVKFHDGTPFNADAAVAWFNRLLDPNFKIGGAVVYLGRISKVEKTGDYSIRFTLKAPSLSFLKDMAQRYSGIGSAKAAAAAGDKFGVQPVGTGAFIFKEYLPGSHVKLARNPDYKWGPAFLKHDGPAYLDEVVFKFIPEDASRTAAIESGNAHVISRTPYADATRLTKNTKFTVVSNYISGVPQYNALNVSIEPTNDLKVRQAIIYATDTAGVVKTVYFGLTKPAYGPVNQWQPNFEPKVKDMYSYNPEKAKQLLTEAGWKPGADGIREKDGKKLMVIIGQNQGWNEWVEFLQANLKAVGFDAKISTLTSAANTERGNSCKEAMPCNGGVNYDPLALNGFFGTKASSNWSCLKDAKLDALIDEAVTTLDWAKRDQLIKQIQLHIMENAYMLPIVELAFYTTMQANVEGIVYDATGFFPLLLDARIN
jgi:peptide/nickel transport system substrate-binding protein